MAHGALKNGDPGANRTRGPFLRREALYLPELRDQKHGETEARLATVGMVVGDGFGVVGTAIYSPLTGWLRNGHRPGLISSRSHKGRQCWYRANLLRFFRPALIYLS